MTGSQHPAEPAVESFMIGLWQAWNHIREADRECFILTQEWYKNMIRTDHTAPEYTVLFLFEGTNSYYDIDSIH